MSTNTFAVASENEQCPHGLHTSVHCLDCMAQELRTIQKLGAEKTNEMNYRVATLEMNVRDLYVFLGLSLVAVFVLAAFICFGK